MFSLCSLRRINVSQRAVNRSRTGKLTGRSLHRAHLSSKQAAAHCSVIVKVIDSSLLNIQNKISEEKQQRVPFSTRPTGPLATTAKRTNKFGPQDFRVDKYLKKK